MKVFITKYALTKGVIERDGERATWFPGCVTFKEGLMVQREGVNWHLTRESAVEKAETMRLKEIESLRNRIAKLEALKFS
jgi:hypothetical protein